MMTVNLTVMSGMEQSIKYVLFEVSTQMWLTFCDGPISLHIQKELCDWIIFSFVYMRMNRCEVHKVEFIGS